MEKQEPIKKETQLENFTNKFKVNGLFFVNLFWKVLIVITIISVMGLLYDNGFIGASNLLFKLFNLWLILTIIFLCCYGYLYLINYLIKKSAPRRLEQKRLFKEELIKEIKKEMNGRTRKHS